MAKKCQFMTNLWSIYGQFMVQLICKFLWSNKHTFVPLFYISKKVLYITKIAIYPLSIFGLWVFLEERPLFLKSYMFLWWKKYYLFTIIYIFRPVKYILLYQPRAPKNIWLLKFEHPNKFWVLKLIWAPIFGRSNAFEHPNLMEHKW